MVQFGGGGWLGRLKMIRGLNGVEMIQNFLLYGLEE